MICSNCGKDVKVGLFIDQEDRMTVICKQCLLKYQKYLNGQHCSHRDIYAWWLAGFAVEEIADHFCVNPLIVAHAIEMQERDRLI